MSWPKVDLHEVCLFENGDRGKNYPGKSSLVDAGIAFVNAGNLQEGAISTEGLSFITEEHYDRLSNGKFRRGDFLFCLRGTLGKFALVDRDIDGAIASSLIILRPQAKLHPAFLKHYLKSDLCTAQVNLFKNGAAQPNLAAASLKKFKIPLPPLEEQKRIAGILDQADALCRLRRRALDRLNTLGQAIFYEMFGEGDAPESEIRDLGKVQTGSTPSTKLPEYFNGNIPFMTPGDLESDGAIGRFVSEQGAKNSRTVQPGATLVCCIGATIGKMGIAKQRSAFNQQINAIDWSDAVLPEYGLYAMRGIRNDIIHIGKGAATTLPILKKSLFEKMKIRVAPLETQKVFIQRVQNIEANNQRFSTALNWQQTLFASLQHRAFRGEL